VWVASRRPDDACPGGVSPVDVRQLSVSRLTPLTAGDSADFVPAVAIWWRRISSLHSVSTF